MDEQPDSTAVTPDTLLHLCSTIGDAKATLKFFVMHTIPASAGATIVPPIAEPSRINTETLTLNAPARTPSRHSKDGSMSSVSEVFDRGTSNSDWSEIAAEEADGYGSLVRRATTRSVRMGRVMGSSGSPMLDSAASGSTGPTSPLPSPTRLTSNLPPKGNTTPTPDRYTSNAQAGPSSASAGPSRAGPTWSAGLGLSIEEEMDEDTRALIAQLQAQEEEETAARRRQLEADEELARREQQQERDVWEMMHEIEHQRTRQEQIRDDEQRAVSSPVELY